MKGEELRRIALALPEAREEPHHQRASFRVGGRIFATLAEDGREAMVKVPSPDDLEALLEAYPEVFFSYGGWTTRLGSLGVHLPRARVSVLRPLVVEAWRSVAPRRAQARLADGDPPRRGRGR